MHAANDFLRLIRHPKLPLFDPLVTETSVTGISSNGNKVLKENWHPASIQFYNAINLLVICWGTPPGRALQSIKTEFEKSKAREPSPSLIKGLNTIIKSDKWGRTLQQMINQLRKRNGKIRQFHFNLLNDILLKNYDEKSSF